MQLQEKNTTYKNALKEQNIEQAGAELGQAQLPYGICLYWD